MSILGQQRISYDDVMILSCKPLWVLKAGQYKNKYNKHIFPGGLLNVLNYANENPEDVLVISDNRKFWQSQISKEPNPCLIVSGLNMCIYKL